MKKEQARAELVGSDKCVWCKKTPDEDIETVYLETGEIICEPCLGDCRQWNRTIIFQTVISTQLPAEDRREVSKAAYNAGREKLDELGYHGDDHHSVSNAEDGYGEID